MWVRLGSWRRARTHLSTQHSHQLSQHSHLPTQHSRRPAHRHSRRLGSSRLPLRAAQPPAPPRRALRARRIVPRSSAASRLRAPASPPLATAQPRATPGAPRRPPPLQRRCEAAPASPPPPPHRPGRPSLHPRRRLRLRRKQPPSQNRAGTVAARRPHPTAVLPAIHTPPCGRDARCAVAGRLGLHPWPPAPPVHTPRSLVGTLSPAPVSERARGRASATAPPEAFAHSKSRPGPPRAEPPAEGRRAPAPVSRP
mmetsp:Transcript_18995/g.62085  ORF Transcript_18995/g.62085 Transcript_18995/m.62085 type:complete len:254 (+) Transcript_18995:1034-1795(+)